MRAPCLKSLLQKTNPHKGFPMLTFYLRLGSFRPYCHALSILVLLPFAMAFPWGEGCRDISRDPTSQHGQQPEPGDTRDAEQDQLTLEVVMILKQLVEFLDKNGIKYVVVHHSQAFTAREVAASAHIPGKEVAKTVIVKIDGKAAMAVLPASQMIDLHLLRDASAARKVELAGEGEFNKLFPDCEVGAMPPFGNLFEMEVLVADTLLHNEEITHLIQKAETMRAAIVVLSSSFEPGERLIALGGIAALLRYRVARQ